jgi:DNA-directed RNA polymerase subunit M/transcription elongation factor TFIIS
MAEIYDALSTVIEKKNNIEIFTKNLNKLGLSEEEMKRATYQVVGDILSLKEGEKMKPILEDVKAGKVCWRHKTFDETERLIQEHDDYILHPFNVVEGVLECKKCGSKRTFSCQKQVRSSDEPMTTFTRCAMCGNQWKYDG